MLRICSGRDLPVGKRMCAVWGALGLSAVLARLVFCYDDEAAGGHKQLAIGSCRQSVIG